MLNWWEECKLSDEMEPQINADERRCEFMHLCSSAVFLLFEAVVIRRVVRDE
ncbi:MAG: hypothetical protein K0A89_06425 [ANME-2 cluster archaeon]|nr:hypothetical protein [ANME-2 cluster archaeon]